MHHSITMGSSAVGTGEAVADDRSGRYGREKLFSGYAYPDIRDGGNPDPKRWSRKRPDRLSVTKLTWHLSGKISVSSASARHHGTLNRACALKVAMPIPRMRASG